MSVRTTIARNTVFNALGRFWEALSSLVLMRYIVEKVGLPAYGVWALVSVFTGYVALLDFGIGSSYVKYIAEHHARDEADEMSSVVTTGLAFYAVFALAIIAVGWPCLDWAIAGFVRLQAWRGHPAPASATLADIRFLLRWGLVLFGASNCLAAFTSIQTGMQRMGLTNIISFFVSLLKIVATIFFLERGHGVRGLLYTNGLTLAAFGLASVAAAFWLAPSLRITPRHLRLTTLSKLFSFGWRAQVSRLANLIMFETDKVVVGAVFSQLGLVALYELGINMANKMRQVPALLVSALVPAASDLDAREEHTLLQQLYMVSTKYVSAVTIPLALLTAASAGMIMRTWMGEKPGIDLAAGILRIIAVGYVANVVPGAGMSIALGKGRADIFMKAGVIATVANILLTLLLVWWWGFWGVATATALSMFISWAWFAEAMSRVVAVPVRRMVRRALLWPVLASIPGVIVCGTCDWWRHPLTTRVGSLLTMDPQTGLGAFAVNGLLLLGSASFFTASYLCLIRLTPFLDAFDVDFLGTTLRLRRLPGFATWTRRAARV